MPPAAANNHNNESISNQHHKPQTAAEPNFPNTNMNEEDSTNNLRNKLESPTGSFDSNNSNNANNVPGQISSTEITRMKKVYTNCI